ncbi:DUF2140 family protein [Peribacillus frigoritolerans]|nr:DUF2140 family protein [Peribacillus frigoritolerans]
MQSGKMNLPVSYVMNLINERYNMPEWVSISPNDESIYVSLQDMELKSDIRVKAKEFDLKNDDISFFIDHPIIITVIVNKWIKKPGSMHPGFFIHLWGRALGFLVRMIPDLIRLYKWLRKYFLEMPCLAKGSAISFVPAFLTSKSTIMG